MLATPTWHPAPGMPIRKLLVKRGDTWEPKTEIIGPGYRAAYGLVAIVHHQIMERNERGEPQGQKVALESDSKGYRFKLTPPVPVTVLDGDVRGDPKASRRLVPLATVP